MAFNSKPSNITKVPLPTSVNLHGNRLNTTPGHSVEAGIDPVHPDSAGKAPAQPTFHGKGGAVDTAKPPKAAPAQPKNPVASKLNVKGDTQ